MSLDLIRIIFAKAVKNFVFISLHALGYDGNLKHYIKQLMRNHVKRS